MVGINQTPLHQRDAYVVDPVADLSLRPEPVPSEAAAAPATPLPVVEAALPPEAVAPAWPERTHLGSGNGVIVLETLQ